MNEIVLRDQGLKANPYPVFSRLRRDSPVCRARGVTRSFWLVTRYDDVVFVLKDNRFAAGHDEFWCDVLDEWTSANAFQNRVHNLKNDGGSTQASHNGTSYLNLTTLRDDTSIDQIDMLNGSSGNDWFIFQGGEDKVVGESSLEELYDITNL